MDNNIINPIKHKTYLSQKIINYDFYFFIPSIVLRSTLLEFRMKFNKSWYSLK